MRVIQLLSNIINLSIIESSVFFRIHLNSYFFIIWKVSDKLKQIKYLFANLSWVAIYILPLLKVYICNIGSSGLHTFVLFGLKQNLN